MDGLNVFKSSNYTLWPILCRVVDPILTSPSIVGIYGGPELKELSTEDFRLNNCDFPVKLSIASIICDKQSIGHGGYYGCDKCTQKGLYHVNKIIFPITDSPVRTDIMFRRDVVIVS
ncbi:hypothetical protein EG68_09762 [Paragonimus skrjabini miyazakii]|uniref:Uncharacterized protein n=1 Tax=Paragonimus skrjabini miyazakii TaxID=59628 RepID=A0A8S9YFC9_9TREM|nr:hypothetical protein EG68_09762 [Paragonimus skrjabini miyazakii]